MGLKGTDKVVLFPPLPTQPEPPSFPPDERQGRFQGIVGRLAEQLGGDVDLAVTNTVSGFPASAVNLARLKEALESAIASFDMALVHERWEADVADWLTTTLRHWVQRCKSMKLDRREKGIHVEIETQDDRGYYHYAFDVFPGRK